MKMKKTMNDNNKKKNIEKLKISYFVKYLNI